MTNIVRKLDQKRNWDGVPWLTQDDCQAQVTNCLRTVDNKLSVFVIDEHRFDRVIAALALTRDNLSFLDLAIADVKVLEDCEIEDQAVPGNTPDLDVNRWHRDLVRLSIGSLTRLARALRQSGSIVRVQKLEVIRAVKESVDNGHVDHGEFKEGMVKSLKTKGII